jgi:hypothetical protein
MAELFGVDEGNPFDRDAAWGLVVHLALTPQHGGRLVELDEAGAEIVLPDGTTQRWDRFARADCGTTAWWQVPALCGDLKGAEVLQ